MRTVEQRLVLSPTDLVGFLSCDHLSRLDQAALNGSVARPVRPDEELALLLEKGSEHDRRYLAHLRSQGLRVTEIAQLERSESGLLAAHAATVEAMYRGDDVIYQATLVEDGWSGQADFLRRVDRHNDPSRLGPWGYEPEDTKLALSAKAGALLQLLTYARLVEAVQGDMPANVHVVLGRAEVTKASFRVAEFAAFHRMILGRLERLVAAGEPVPDLFDVVRDPVEHCALCPWQEHCATLRLQTGHLSRVAFIRKDEIEKLRAAGHRTVWDLAALGSPVPTIHGMGVEVLARLQDQALMQLEEERTERRFHKVLEHPEPPPHWGLLALPQPSPMDIFFDFEGDRFATEDGLEYLFGWVEAVTPVQEPTQAPFHDLWAHNRAQERAALETFIDHVVERRRMDPGMHVYHYAPYEPSTLHRLTQRHGTRAAELDVLLRAGVFVDLYRVVRQGVRVSSESYSIKRLEKLYNMPRDDDGIAKALSSMLAYERWIASGDQAILDSIRNYNRDDCVSTHLLRDWLEERRAELVETLGKDPGRPPLLSGEVPEVEAEDDEIAELRAALTTDIDPATPDTEPLDEEPQARRLLGNLLGWYRREARTEWFDWYRQRALDADGLRRDTGTIGVSAYVGIVGRVARSDLHRWRFDPTQEVKLRVGDAVVRVPALDPADTSNTGTIHALDLDAGMIDVKISSKKATRMDALDGFVSGAPLPTTEQRRSLLALGRWVAEHGIDADGPNRAVRDLLLGRPPRIRGMDGGAPLIVPEEDPSLAARRIALDLDASCLAIQGPPGSGKTYTGAGLILDLVRAADGRRVVGVTAFSHAAIGNLLREIVRQAGPGANLRIIQKADEGDWCGLPEVERVGNGDVETRLAEGTVDIVAGTPWLWSRPALEGTVDTLVVDEAGQISLANLAAIGRAARNLVLMGDPQQLSQPVMGSHPPGAGRSALEHVLGSDDAIPVERGVFLRTTRRLHPELCDFTSTLFYEGRLEHLAGLEHQAILGDGLLGGSGLRWIPVDHSGRASVSPEEVEVVASCVSELLGRSWRNRAEIIGQIRPQDILVVSPYNAQVARLRQVLPTGVHAGTVDKFQGREAPVVIYTMATSTPDEMRRDMSFLFSANRFNVATSRAQVMVVLVCSPALLTVPCHTPEQMRLANTLAYFVESALQAVDGCAASSETKPREQ